MKAAVVLIIALIVGGVLAAFALVASQPQPERDVISGADDGSESIPIVFENATNLTNNEQDSVYGQVAAWNNSVYVIWQDSVSGRNYDIFIKKSVDNGTTFGPDVNLSKNSGFSEHPQLSVYGSNVYAVWADNSQGNREIFFSRSTDEGTNFGAVQNLSNDTSDSHNQEMAAFGEDVYVTWVDRDMEDNARILLKASSYSGATFGRATEISNVADIGSYPKIAAVGNDVYVTWNVIGGANEGLYFAKSSDGGSTFGNATKLDDSPGEPQVAAYNGTVFVISGGLDPIEVNGLRFFKSTDGGETFSDPVQIDAEGEFVNPTNVEIVAVSEEEAYIAGQVFVGGNEEILLLPISSDNATGTVNLSKNAKISECPSIAIAGDNVYVVWEDLTPGNHEVLYAKGSKI